MRKKTIKNKRLEMTGSQEQKDAGQVSGTPGGDMPEACNEQPGKPDQTGEDEIPCDFCTRWCDAISKEEPAGAMPAYVMTEREYRILTDMKRIKEDARNIKNRMGEIEKCIVDNMLEIEAAKKKPELTRNDPKLQCISQNWLSLAQRLDALKGLWKHRDRERLEAAEERMRLLGHIQ